MGFVPHEELAPRTSINLAPMIDFLFLMLAFFACLAISRVAMKDTRIDLVEVKPDATSAITAVTHEINMIRITIDKENNYYWETDLRDYRFTTADSIYEELSRQYQKGLIPEDKGRTKVMLKIDKDAQWDNILKAIFAIRDAGFEARPVYEPMNKNIAEG